MSGETATIIASLIAAIAAIAVAIIEGKAVQERKSHEKRAERRAKESRLSMELMSATCDLACVTAMALRDGHTNGTLEPALAKAAQAQADYQDFLKDEAAAAVAKV